MSPPSFAFYFSFIGAVSHIAATVLIFAVMIQALPETTRLGLRDVAPIIATLLLLANTVIVLLLWNQLQITGIGWTNRPRQ